MAVAKQSYTALPQAGHLVVSFSTAACIIYDAETQAVVTRLDTAQDPVSGQVKAALCSRVVGITVL